MLNEFLKEHKTVQDLKAVASTQAATITQMKKQIDALTAGLQKVTARVDSGEAALRVASEH